MVPRQIAALLENLTPGNFDTVSDKVIRLCNNSSEEEGGRTLHKVIGIAYDKATRNKNKSAMYTRLCRKMMEQISPLVQDKGIKNREGEPMRGGQLFRNYLLNRCQEDFERICGIGDPESASVGSDYGTGLHSKEGRLQGVDLVRFLCDLFKLQMLTQTVMQECIKALLRDVENPREYLLEMACELLVTVGHILDTPKARAVMDEYFSRVKQLASNQGLTPRIRFMLQDVIELRERKWVRNDNVL